MVFQYRMRKNKEQYGIVSCHFDILLTAFDPVQEETMDRIYRCFCGWHSEQDADAMEVQTRLISMT